MARAAVAAGEAQRVGVHELRLAAGDRRALAVGDARVDRKRRSLGFAAELDRRLHRQIPGMVKIEIGPSSRKARGIGKAGSGILRGIARDRERLAHRRRDRIVGEVRGARVAAPLADVHGDADALVAVV